MSSFYHNSGENDDDRPQRSHRDTYQGSSYKMNNHDDSSRRISGKPALGKYIELNTLCLKYDVI